MENERGLDSKGKRQIATPTSNRYHEEKRLRSVVPETYYTYNDRDI